MQAYILNETTILGEKSFRDLVFREHQLQPKFLEHEICRLLFWEYRAKQYKYEIFRILFLESQASYKTVSAGYCFENPSNFQNLKFEKYCFGNLKPCTEHNMNIAGY